MVNRVKVYVIAISDVVMRDNEAYVSAMSSTHEFSDEVVPRGIIVGVDPCPEVKPAQGRRYEVYCRASSDQSARGARCRLWYERHRAVWQLRLLSSAVALPPVDQIPRDDASVSMVATGESSELRSVNRPTSCTCIARLFAACL
jgi:hypothetical protein